MNSKMIPVIVLVLMSVIFGITALLLFMQSRSFTHNMIQTHAQVAAISPIGGNGQRIAIVEFTDTEGNFVRKKAQAIGSFGVKTGDQVTITYTRKALFGKYVWNIFILKDSSSHPYRLYEIIGSVMLAAAVILSVAGIRILLK